MASFKEIIDQQIGNAFNILNTGGLTETVTFRYLTAGGTLDVENDTNDAQFENVPGVVVVTAKPILSDITDYGVVFTDTKLIVPGTSLPRDLQTESDKVLRANGEEWGVRKTVGVPGRGVFLVFIMRT